QSRKVLKDGWFHTGDIGRFAPNGQLVITGRKKRLVNRRGELVSPERVDIRARNHPHVLEAYSVGVPDAVHGERLVTACLLKDGGTSERVETYLRAHLSPSHCPDLVLALAQFPRTETGKVDGRRLK